jgi:Flp pilus assembly pilin Flp
MLSLYLKAKSLMNDEEGQTAVEYCIMIGVVALSLIAIAPGLASAVSSFFARVGTKLGTLAT